MRDAARCVARLAVNNESFMSDNNDNSFTDRYSTKRASQAWEEASSPIVRFRTDMERVGDLSFITSNMRVLSATHCF